jgi:ferritin
MIKKKVIKALNQQINEETYSAYLYQAMSANFSSKGLNGIANWFRIQALEEMVHAMKLYDFILERSADVTLLAIKQPPKEWKTALEAFEAAYKHETYITDKIDNLMTLAIAQKDHATASFLGWFVDEQVEEEASAGDIVQKLKLIGKNGAGLYQIDRELAARVFTPPPAGE